MSYPHLEFNYQQAPIALNANLDMPAMVRTNDTDWVRSPQDGVMRKLLERVGGEQVRRATSLVEYAPGASFTDHCHLTGEEFLVLDGVLHDENGVYPKGSYIRNPPGSHHKPFSKTGCRIFVKLGQFHWSDKTAMRVDTRADNPEWTQDDRGMSQLGLFGNAFERAHLVNMRAGLKTYWPRAHKGLEIFVVKGRLAADFGIHNTGDWIRIPAGHAYKIRAVDESELYIKTGHLT